MMARSTYPGCWASGYGGVDQNRGQPVTNPSLGYGNLNTIFFLPPGYESKGAMPCDLYQGSAYVGGAPRVFDEMPCASYGRGPDQRCASNVITAVQDPHQSYRGTEVTRISCDGYSGAVTGTGHQGFDEMPGARYGHGHIQGTYDIVSTMSHSSDNSYWSVKITGQQPKVGQSRA